MLVRPAVLLCTLLLACSVKAQLNAPIQKPEYISDTIPIVMVPAKPFSEKNLIGIWYEHNSRLGDHIYHVICRDTAGALWHKVFNVVSKRIEQMQQNPLQSTSVHNQFQYTDYIDPALTGTISFSADSIFLDVSNGSLARRVEYIGHAAQELWRGNIYYDITVLSGWRFERFTLYLYSIKGNTYAKFFDKDDKGPLSRYYYDKAAKKKTTPEGRTSWIIDGEEYTESENGEKISVLRVVSEVKGWHQTLKPAQ